MTSRGRVRGSLILHSLQHLKLCPSPTGSSCGVLGYKKTPIAGHDLFPINRSHNTWNGPIVGPVAGKYHLYDPLYGNYTGIKSLFRVEYIMHGTGDTITGPYDWTSEPTIPGGINPAALTYVDNTTGKTIYTLWNGGIRAADSPDGPWTKLPGRNPCGLNPAPAYHNGMFYCTSQHTTEIYSSPQINTGWTKLSDINITTTGGKSVGYSKLVQSVEE